MRWLALLVIAACGGSTPPQRAPATPSPDAAPAFPDLEAELARVRALVAQACACSDLACLAEVDRAYAAYLDVATMPDPVDGTSPWTEDQVIEAEDLAIEILECFQAQRAPVVETANRYEVRKLERFADHACACRDGACLVETRDALGQTELEDMYDTGDPQQADRIRGAMTKLGRCLAPVVEDELAAIISDLEARRQQACACTNAACGGAVAGALMTWLGEIDLVRAALVTNARVQALLVEVSTCLRAVP